MEHRTNKLTVLLAIGIGAMATALVFTAHQLNDFRSGNIAMPNSKYEYYKVGSGLNSCSNQQPAYNGIDPQYNVTPEDLPEQLQ